MGRFTLSFLLLFSLSRTLFSDCTPAGTPGDDTVECTGVINTFQYFYGGSDRVTLTNVSDITYYNSYWLDETLGGNPATDGNDTFIAYNSRFHWVLAFGGDDTFEIYNSQFDNLYGDTNPGHGVSQRGNDTIYIENSHSTGWILGGNDNDHITIKDSNVSFVAAGYSDIYGAIDYTPYDGNDTVILDHTSFTAVNYYYTTRPGAVEGGKADDRISFINGGEAFNVTGGHGNDVITLSDAVHFTPCSFTNDLGNVVACGIYGDEPYLSEPNASTIPLTHGNDEIFIESADVSGTVVHGGDGSDRVMIDTAAIIAGTVIDGGDDRGVTDGFIDSLYFDQWSGDLNASYLLNWEQIIFDNASMISFLDENISTGYEHGIYPATMLPYGLVLQNSSSWMQYHDFVVEGNLYNEAVITMQDGDTPGVVVTVENNYTANQGLLYIDTVLDDALPSKSDKLLVRGDTAGTTILSVENVGGAGAQTPVGDNVGILVVEVEGASHGVFVLDQTLDIGNYFYHLLKGSNGNWYLQSEEKRPSLDLYKSTAIDFNAGTIALGDHLGYTITATNTGNTTLSNILLNDILITPGTQSCASLLPHETCILEGNLTVTQTDIDRGEILNSATAKADGIERLERYVTTAIIQIPAGKLQKSLLFNEDNDGNGEVSLGDRLHYEVNLTNTGNITLHNVIIEDTILIPTMQRCSMLAPTAVCTLRGIHTVTQEEVDHAELNNTASGSSDETGILQSNTVSLSIPQHPALIFSKEANLSSISAPGSIGYTLTATNTGNLSLTEVNVNDILPDGSSIVPLYLDGDSDSDGILDIGERWVYRVSYAVTQSDIDTGSTVTNMASISTAEGAGGSDYASTAVVWLIPILENDTLEIMAAGSISGNVAGNDFVGSCRPSEAIWVMTEGPIHGEILFEENGAFLYTPEEDYRGEDTFSYTVMLPEGCPEANSAVVSMMIDTPCWCADIHSDRGNSMHFYALFGMVFGLFFLLRREEINSF